MAECNALPLNAAAGPIPKADSWCQTEIHEISFSHIWIIKKFSHLPQKAGERLESLNFSDHANNTRNWRLWLYPRGEGFDDSQDLSLYLVLVSKAQVSAKFKFSIVNAKGEKTIKAKTDLPHLFVYNSPTENRCGVRNLISRDYLFDDINGILPNDCLTLYCKVMIFSNLTSFSGRYELKDPGNSLSDDLGQLLESRQLGDVLLVVKDNHELQAHKAILAARSPVFSAMFKHNMEENKSNKVEITDMSFEVLVDLLQFIYTGEAPNLTKVAQELLAAADKYQLEGLKSLCEKALSINLTVRTVAEIFILANLHNANFLKRNALDFIKCNGKDVKKTEGWKLLTGTHLQLILDTLL